MRFLQLIILDLDTSFFQNILEQRASPFAVHDSTIEPVDAGHLLQLCTHGMTPIAGAL
jgi:hypothetical protein